MGFALTDIGVTVSISEAARLVRLLASDHSTRIGAALQDWTRPATTHELVLMHLYDAFVQVNYKNAVPWQRPWDRPTQIGTPAMSRDDAIALLKAARNGTRTPRAEAING